MVVTLGQQCNVGEKPIVIMYIYIDHHAEPSKIDTVVHSSEGSTNIPGTIRVPSNHIVQK